MARSRKSRGPREKARARKPASRPTVASDLAPTDAKAGKVRGGKIKFNEFVIKKSLDRASPAFFSAPPPPPPPPPPRPPA